MDKKRQETLYKLLGENVKKNRTRLKLTQDKLADKLKLPRTSIVSIEQGKQQMSVHLLVTLTEIFGVSVDTLIPKIEDGHSLIQTNEGPANDVKDLGKPKLDEFLRNFFKDQKP